MSIKDFDEKTRANMEVALDRACSSLPPDLIEAHEARSKIALVIEEAAKGGERTLTGLTSVGRQAAKKVKTAG